MTLPTNLFIDSPDSEDVSMTHLSTDATEWPDQIITKLKERIPATATSSLSIKFMHKDEDTGTAVGSVTMTNGQISAVAPIVIREFELHPLDVMLFQGKIVPLNPDSYAGIFQNGTESPFAKLDEYPAMTGIDRFLRGENLQSAIFPPNWGRYSFASDQSSLLESLQGTCDGTELFKKAMADEKVVANMWKNETLSILKKTANLHPVNMNEFRQGVDKLVMRTRHVLKKDGPNRYTLLSNAADTFNPLITPMDRLDAGRFCSSVSQKPQSVLHDVDQNGEKVIVVEDDSEDPVFLAKRPMEAIVSADSYGRYNVRTNKTGMNVEGFVFPLVVDFHQNQAPVKIFIGKSTSTLQTEIYGTQVTTSDWMPEGSCPKVGQTGTFVYRDGDRKGVATLPVTIKGIYTDYVNPNEMKIRAVDMSGRELSLRISTDMELERIAALSDTKADGTVKPYFLIPGRMEWLPMEGFDDVSSTPYEYSVKTAAEDSPAHRCTLVSMGYGEWALRGTQKYASAMDWDSNRLQSHEAKFLMASCGLREPDIEKGMKTASLQGSWDFGLKKMPPLWEEKVATHIPAARRVSEAAGSLRTDLTKVASYIENAQTVDALLSLNFVNGENVGKFVSKIPLFKSALSNLCACLLASRLGIREIPEQSAMSAVGKLGEVIRGLEILRATQSAPTKK